MMDIVEFRNSNGSFSHWSVCELDQQGAVVELSTTVMHTTYLAAWRELQALSLV